MYPRLHDLLNDLFNTNWFNTPVQTFGFFMALGFVAAFFYLKFAMKEKTRQSIFREKKITEKIGGPVKIFEVISNAFFGFLIGWKVFPAILNYEELVEDPQSYILSLNGSILAGFIIAVLFGLYTYVTKKKQELETPKLQSAYLSPHEFTGDIIGVAAISGVLGAKLLSVFEDWSAFINDPFAALFSFSGLTWYGGLIGGTLAVSWYIYKRKSMISYKPMLDAAAPAVMIGYAVGRLGCHFSGDGDWGIVNSLKKPFEFLPDWLWAYNYPNNVISYCHSQLKDGSIVNGNCNFFETPYLISPVWPTSVYEFLIGSLIFLILVSLRNRFKAPGVLFSVFLIFNGMERFMIEIWRINERYAFGLSLSQFIALGLIIIGFLGVLFFSKTNKEVVLDKIEN